MCDQSDKATLVASVEMARCCNRWLIAAKKEKQSDRVEYQRMCRDEWIENARIYKRTVN